MSAPVGARFRKPGTNSRLCENPPVDWDDLRTFLAVARAGSLAEAARGLAVSYSTVSRRLAALEQALGVRLFDRSGAAYQLTPEGEQMIASAERMEAEFEALSRQVSGRDARLSGRVRVATTDALATTFMPEIAPFTRRYPEIEIDLLSTPEPAELAMRVAEVALLVTDRPPPSLVGRRLAALPSALRRAAIADRGRRRRSFAGHLWVIRVGRTGCRTSRPRANCASRLPDARIALPRRQRRDALCGDPRRCQDRPPCSLHGRRGSPLLQLRLCRAQAEMGAWLLTHEDLRTTSRVRQSSSTR
jgi:DNA-binding transcriptional LysR family regulator